MPNVITQKLNTFTSGMALPKLRIEPMKVKIPAVTTSRVVWSIVFLLDLVAIYLITHIDQLVLFILLFNPFE